MKRNLCTVTHGHEQVPAVRYQAQISARNSREKEVVATTCQANTGHHRPCFQQACMYISTAQCFFGRLRRRPPCTPTNLQRVVLKKQIFTTSPTLNRPNFPATVFVCTAGFWTVCSRTQAGAAEQVAVDEDRLAEAAASAAGPRRGRGQRGRGRG